MKYSGQDTFLVLPCHRGHPEQPWPCWNAPLVLPTVCRADWIDDEIRDGVESEWNKKNEMQWAGCSFLCFRAAVATRNNHGRVGKHLSMDSFSVTMTHVRRNEEEQVPPCRG